jgi:hypothetical protein
VMTITGNCHVDDTRNDIARTFLDSEADRLMFIDSDVNYSADSIARLWGFDKDIIGGVYPYKNDEEGFPYLKLDGELTVNDHGIGRVAGLPGGFVMIKREVIEKLWRAGVDKFGAWKSKGSDNIYASRPIAQIWYRENVPFENGQGGQFMARRLSGDYRFCESAVEAGYELWCDPQLSLGHIGEKMWSGSLIRHELTKSGRWPNVINAHFSRIKSIDEVEAKGDAIMQAMHVITDAYGNKPFACGPVLCATLYSIASNPEIKTVLETGTGVTTAVLRKTGKRIRSLESEKVWGAKTEEFLEMAGVAETEGSVISYAKLAQRKGSPPWYDFILGYTPDLLFIDGPRRDQAGMRGEVLNRLPGFGNLPKVVVVDDVDDGDGMRILQKLTEMGYACAHGMEPGRRAFAVCEFVGKEAIADMIEEGVTAAE